MEETRPYKTHLGWRNYVGVSLLVHGRSTPVDGIVRDISMTGVSITFRESDVPELCAGDAVTLRLTASWLPRPVVAGGCLAGSRRDVEGIVYDFDFANADVVEEQITPVLHSVFNRRRAPRVVPNPEDDTRVVFQSAGSERASMAELHQVSSSGISIKMPPGDDPGAPIGSPTGISFYLAGRSEATRMAAYLRSRRHEGTHLVLGFEYDGERTPDFEKIQGAILGYVLSRAPVPVQLFD